MVGFDCWQEEEGGGGVLLKERLQDQRMLWREACHIWLSPRTRTFFYLVYLTSVVSLDVPFLVLD